MRETTYAVRERRGSKVAVVPLGLLAAVFVLPTYRGCHDEDFQSPLHFALNGESPTWVVPVFLCAAALALLTLRALGRGEVDRFTRRAGLACLALFSMSEVAVGIWWAAGSSNDWPWLVSSVVASAIAALLVRTARGLRPWQIWEHLLAAFAVLAAVSVPTFFLFMELYFGGGGLGPGGYLFDASLVSLWGILGLAVFRAHRVRASASTS